MENEVWVFLHHRFQFSRSRRKVHISHQSDELKEQLLKEVKCSVRIYFICTKVKHAWNLVGSLSPGRVIRHTYELMEIAHVEIHRPSEHLLFDATSFSEWNQTTMPWLKCQWTLSNFNGCKSFPWQKRDDNSKDVNTPNTKEEMCKNKFA